MTGHGLRATQARPTSAGAPAAGQIHPTSIGRKTQIYSIGRQILAVGILCLTGVPVFPEQRILKTVTSHDGLPHDRVYRVLSDSRGFLWFCTSGGITRFDGQHLVNFGSEAGAPFVSTNDMLEMPDGTFWIGTNGEGVVRMNTYAPLQPAPTPGSQPIFRSYTIPGNDAANRANRLLADRSGGLWIGTDAGLFHLTESKGKVEIRPVPLGIPGQPSTQVEGLAEGEDGSLWVGTLHGLVRVLPAGGRIYYPRTSDNAYFSDLGAVTYDSGVVWYGQSQGLFLLRPAAVRGALQPGEVQVDQSLIRAERTGSPPRFRLPQSPGQAALFQPGGSRSGHNIVSAIHRIRQGVILAGTDAGVFEYRDAEMRRILADFPYRHILDFGEDPAGNLWIATQNSGVAKIEPAGHVSYDRAKGLVDGPVSVTIDRDGEVVALGGGSLFVLSDDRLRPLKPNFPDGAALIATRSLMQDRLGQWWFGTTKGVLRFPPAAHASNLTQDRPTYLQTRGPGLADNEVFLFFEDSRGDVWMPGAPDPLTRWERSSGKFFHYSSADGLPKEPKPDVVTEDHQGSVLLGFRNGSIMRYRDGHFYGIVQSANNLPGAHVGGIALDSRNRIWASIGHRGLVCIEEKSPGRFETQTYSTDQGIGSSPSGSDVFVDAAGLVYVGSSHGVDRLNPETGAVEHFGPADGIPDEYVTNFARGADGAIWVATANQLVRMAAGTSAGTTAALGQGRVLIGGLHVSGVEYQVPPVGANNLALGELSYLNNSLQIDFLWLSFAPGQSRLFQWKLEGADSEWSAPSATGTVNYANLSPGEYRFLVRRAGLGERTGAPPAQLTFRILPPVWKRSWFAGSIAALALLVLFAFERYRASKVKQLRSAMASLRSANEALDLETAITRILSNSSDESACPALIETLCLKTGWGRGALWFKDRDTGLLHLAAEWPGPPSPSRILFPGQDLASRSVEQKAIEHGAGHIAVPILLGGNALGSIELSGSDSGGGVEPLVAAAGLVGQWLERLRAERALRASEARFRTLAETASDAILTINEEGIVLFANPAAADVFGYEPEQIVGRELTMLMPVRLREMHRQGFGRYLETSERRISWKAVELPGLHAKGHEISLDLSFGEFTRDNTRLFTALIRDVTERKQTEEALRRSREERLAEIERVRRRIATDLHDDIGSSLTQISVLSEVARRELQGSASLERPLETIARSSQELIDSMSDIVWAINPQRDHLRDLVHRMRRFAADTLTARNIEFSLILPDSDVDIKLEGNLRREIFLIFKEALNNAVRHSGCAHADIEMTLRQESLLLRVADDGKGFDTTGMSEGHGLVSMSGRAEGIGGSFKVVSAAGQGCVMVLEVPLSSPTSTEST